MRVSMYEGLPGKKGVKRRLCTVQGGAAAPICQRRGIGGAVISYGGGATSVYGPHHWTPHPDDVRGGRGRQSSFRPAGSPAPEISVFAPNSHIGKQTWWRPVRAHPHTPVPTRNSPISRINGDNGNRGGRAVVRFPLWLNGARRRCSWVPNRWLLTGYMYGMGGVRAGSTEDPTEPLSHAVAATRDARSSLRKGRRSFCAAGPTWR
jgi:hypothetical protein